MGRDSCTYCTSSLAEGLRNIRKTTARVTRCRVAFSKPGLYKCEIGVPPLRLRKYSIFFILRRDARRTFMLKFQCHWHFVYVGISMPLTLYVEISMPLTLRLCWNFNATDTLSSNSACDFGLVLCWTEALKFGQCLLCSRVLFVICCRSSETPSSPAQRRNFASIWMVGADSKARRINAHSV